MNSTMNVKISRKHYNVHHISKYLELKLVNRDENDHILHPKVDNVKP